MLRKAAGSLVLLVSFAAITGCASTQGVPAEDAQSGTRVAAESAEFTGFLGDYSGLEPDPTDSSLLWFEVDDFNWLDYNGVMLDPLVVYLSPKAENRQIETDQIRALADYFEEAVRAELKEDYPIVDEAAPGVLRIRAALTDLRPANPAVNVVTALAVPVRFDLGGAAIEVEFLDPTSGERLAAMVDRKAGSRMKAWQGFSKWGDARSSFRKWAKELKVALETNPEPPE